MAGVLIVKPLAAELTRDTQLFSKMNPYCVVSFGGLSQKTSVAKRAGKLPTWRDSLIFRKKTIEEVVFEVWSRHKALSDDLVGNAVVHLKEIGTEAFEGWIGLTYRGSSVGKLHVEIQYNPQLRLGSESTGLEEQKSEATVEKTSPTSERKPTPVLEPKKGPRRRHKNEPLLNPTQILDHKRVAVIEPKGKVVDPPKRGLVQEVKSIPVEESKHPLRIAVPPSKNAQTKRHDASAQTSFDNSNVSCRIQIPSSSLCKPEYPPPHQVPLN